MSASSRRQFPAKSSMTRNIRGERSSARVQIAKAISLDVVGKDSEQEVAGEMLWRCPTKLALPARPQSFQIDIAQKCNLLFDCPPLK